jgi:seryl-tRNA synthetase
MAKRARERARQERQEAKRQRRQSVSEIAADVKDEPDEAELMEEFRVLSERHAAGLVAEDRYVQQRHRIFAALGIEPHGAD